MSIRCSAQRPADRVAIDRAIERVGIGHLRGRDVRELSLGERQLVVLAMTIAQGARLLLLDEPTVHLDLRHQIEVMELLRDLAQRDGVTVLAVLHDIGLASHFFPRLILLARGPTCCRRTAIDRPDSRAPARRFRSRPALRERRGSGLRLDSVRELAKSDR